MTVTYLTLNKAEGDISDLVLTAASPDVKAKLQNSWTLWIQTDSESNEEVLEYDTLTKSIVSFSTLDGFWNTFNGVPQPSVFLHGTKKLSFKADSGKCLKIDSIMLFREGVLPQWEDPVNATGGHFQFHWKPAGVLPAQLDEYWNNVVLALIGNTIECEGEFSANPILQGARFVDKLSAKGRQAGIRLEVWFSAASDARHLQKVKSRLEKAMTLKLDGTNGQVPRCEIRYHSKRS